MERKFNRKGLPGHTRLSAALDLGSLVFQAGVWHSCSSVIASPEPGGEQGWDKHPLWPGACRWAMFPLLLLLGADRRFSLFRELQLQTPLKAQGTLALLQVLPSGLRPMGLEPMISTFIAVFLSNPMPVSSPLILVQRSLDDFPLIVPFMIISWVLDY